MEKLLNKIYYNVEHPSSFGGVRKLSKASGISYEKTLRWLSGQPVYSLHRPVRFKFSRRKVISYGPRELLQADLIDVSKYARHNSGTRFILTVIDVFTKFAWAIPLKKKNAESLVKAFQTLFRKTGPFSKLQTDDGKEFFNSRVGQLLKNKKIHHYSSFSEFKASVIERFNRTFRNKLHRIFTHRNSYKYIDVLNLILKSYNDSVHRSIGMAPSQVGDKDTPRIARKLYGLHAEPIFKYNIGDQVRISKAKKTFRRGYLPNWTEEIFTIFKRYKTNPATYSLRDLKATDIEGRFYESELQKVIAPDIWRVEKILRTRGRGSRKEYLVRWLGFPSSFDSWIKHESWVK